MPENRDKTGRFVKGNSANPGGRPKLPDSIKAALGPLGEKSIREMDRILGDPDAKDADKIRIIEIVLDRLLGKAAQPILAEMHQTTGDTMTLSEMMTSLRELMDA